MMHFAACDIHRTVSAAGYLPVAAEGFCGCAAASLAGRPEFSLAALLKSAADPEAKVRKERPKIRAVCIGRSEERRVGKEC